MHDPSELSHEDLVALVRDIQETVWPGGDRDAEWDSDTIDEVATHLINAGVGPDYTDNP